MRRKLCDILVTIYISFVLIYLIVSNVFRMYMMYQTVQISEKLVFFGLVGFIIYILYKFVNRLKIDLFDILIILLGVFGVISAIFAFDVGIALNGFSGRYEGLLQIVTYYVLFLNCKSINNELCKKIIVGIIILSGFIQAVYAILQFFDVETVFGCEVIRRRYYSTGFEVNPNFLGSLMILGLGLSVGIYFFSKNKICSLLTLVSSVILFAGLLCSGAMSAVVGFVFLLLFVIIVLFIIRNNIWLVLGKVLLIFVFCFIIYSKFNDYDNGFYLSQVNKTGYEISETLRGDAEPIYGSGRIHIWMEALKVVPNNLWTGVGIDNFFYAFGDGSVLIDIKSNFAVDKAHNEYLHKLVTEGVFSCFVYLMLLIVIFIKSILYMCVTRKRNVCLLISLFLAFVPYCVQAFFNISVITVAPLFYVVMGLMCSLLGSDKNGAIEC